MKLPGPLTEDQETQLNTIQSSARHLLSLINDLLDVAKIESGKVEVQREPTSLIGLIEEVATALRPLARRKKLSLEVEGPPNDLSVKTDRRKLSQILINLTSNAIKYTDRGAVVIRLVPGEKGNGATHRIAVRDSGCGIREEEQENLFQAFSQLDSSSTRRFEGTGLGLHLSQRLAGLLGGCITCESEVGKGSVFTVELPEEG
jgi:protein-histidine pros-kinase